MAKLLVDVITPGNGQTYDFQLEDTLSCAQAMAKMIENITALEGDTLPLNPATALLCNRNLAKNLEGGQTLRAEGVKSGHTLILV